MSRSEAREKVVRTAVVVLGSAANPAHRGHLHCLSVGKLKAEELGYEVLWCTVAAAPDGYVRRKVAALNLPNDMAPFVLNEETRLELLRRIATPEIAPWFRPPDRCYGSALECGRKLRPSSETTVFVVVGGDRAKRKWTRSPKDDEATVCCARDATQLQNLLDEYEEDERSGRVLDRSYYFSVGVGPDVSSTMVRNLLTEEGLGKEEARRRLLEYGYPPHAVEFLLQLKNEMFLGQRTSDEKEGIGNGAIGDGVASI